MRARTVLPLAVAVLLGPAAPAAAASPAGVRMGSCDPAARTAVVETLMRAVPGTVRMQLRLTLQVREDGGWSRLEVPEFETWVSALPGRKLWLHDQRVEKLAPGAYRMQVRFRWRDALGEVIRTAAKRTRSCRIPDPRPDLVPVRIDVRPGPTAQTRTYEVTIANQGRSRAPDTMVALAVDGVPLPDQPAEAIEPGRRTTTTFVGPACPEGGNIVASVDSTGLVQEAEEADDTLSVACLEPERGRRDPYTS